MDSPCKVCGGDCSPGECYYPHQTLTMNPEVIVHSAYSKVPKKNFQLNFIGENEIILFDPITMTFNTNECTRFSAAIGGQFNVKKDQLGCEISFQGVEMRYFNIIVAVFMEGCWKLQFRFCTSANEIFCTQFKENYILGKLPDKFSMNTALVIGAKSHTLNVNVNLLGKLHGIVHWTPTSFNASEALQVVPFQRIDPNYAQRCPECLVVSPSGHGHLNPCPPIKTVSCLRSSIYANTMTQIFAIRFDDPSYSVQVLDDTVNEFVEVQPGKNFQFIPSHA